MLEGIPGLELGGRSLSVADGRQSYILGGNRESGILLNILMLNHNRAFESSFNRAFFFARPLVRHGHHVTVVTNSHRRKLLFTEYVHEGVNIIETPDLFWGRLRTGWDPLNALRRYGFLKKRRFDIIHATRSGRSETGTGTVKA